MLNLATENKHLQTVVVCNMCGVKTAVLSDHSREFTLIHEQHKSGLAIFLFLNFSTTFSVEVTWELGPI